MNNHDGLLLDASKLAAELRKRGDEWADTDAAFKALDDATKTILAEVFLGTDGTMAEREAKARASQTVKDHMKDVNEARQKANRARVAYDVYRTYVEMNRTNASSQRALVELR